MPNSGDSDPWTPEPVGQKPTWRQSLEDTWNRFRAFSANRLEVGTRITAFALQDTTNPKFLGTINRLKESQSALPLKIFIDWFFHPNWGGELMWDYLRVETGTREGNSDGDWTLTGPVLSVIGRYPNDTQWTPYAGLGFAFYNAGFEPEAWWHLGFHSPDEWIAEGSPGESISGLTQNMQPKDPVGIVVQGGCTYEFAADWLLDLHARFTSVEIDDFHVLSVEGTPIDSRGTYKIPLSHISFGIGIRYAFR
jgi:outer membrane protein W